VVVVRNAADVDDVSDRHVGVISSAAGEEAAPSGGQQVVLPMPRGPAVVDP
jgi:hypothetical protein